MVLIGDKPIIWHVMQIYLRQGFDEFIIATGYKSEVLEEWVASLSDMKVTTIFTGLDTQTGGRIKRCMESFPDEQFFITYGDGVGNIDLRRLLDVHNSSGRAVTVTAVRPPSRFGVLEIDSGRVTHFGEKNQADSGWINGGFFVVNRSVISRIADDGTQFELGPLPLLASQNQLSAYLHEGFWQPMDTLRERNLLTGLANQDSPPWF